MSHTNNNLNQTQEKNMAKKRVMTRAQNYEFMNYIKKKYGDNPPDLFIAEVAEILSKELGFPVSGNAVGAAFDYHGIPRKGKHKKVTIKASDLAETVEALAREVLTLKTKVSVLEGAILEPGQITNSLFPHPVKFKGHNGLQ